MPELIKQSIVVPLDGLSQEVETDGTVLGEETFNFYPDGEGYLVNYPGKTRYFKEPPIKVQPKLEDLGSNDLPDSPGETGSAITVYTAPPTGKFTRIRIYRDFSGSQHIVFVVDDKLCVAEGNGYRVLYTFAGNQKEEACYPSLFTHNNYLIIANLGDPVLIWDGFRNVVPLGVTEAPQPPTVSVGKPPWQTNAGEVPNSSDREVVFPDWHSGL